MESIVVEHWELLVFFFLIALFYSSVGFGGGSSYLAILTLYSVDFLVLRSTALLCNVIVVAGSTYFYHRQGLINWRRIAPLIIFSVPLAYFGGRLLIQEQMFFLLLAAALLLAGVLMWFQPQLQKFRVTDANKLWSDDKRINAGLGGGIGFLAGIVGIGGGIFLSPLLHLTRWAAPKVIAATAAVFILVNSLAGLTGQALRPGFDIDWQFSIPLMLAVGAGGQLGSRLGVKTFSQRSVKRATAILIIFVSLRILWRYLAL